MAQQHRQRQAQIRDEGERMPRVDRQRRQHLVDLAAEAVGQLRALRLVQAGIGMDDDARCAGQLRPQLLLPDRGHALMHLGDGVEEQTQLFGRGAAIVGKLTHARGPPGA
jgi:hypothetical protein